MPKTILVIALILAACPLAAHADKPINNVRDQTISSNADGSPRSLEQVQSVIVEACLARGWQPVVESDGLISATINVRGRHYAKISIPFSSSTYSILYVESDNLDYNAKKQRIHRNYNNWVVKLSGTINKFLSSATQSARTPPGPATDRDDEPDVYAELLKLDDLRERGILTDEEFDAEKAKLLEGN